MSIASIPATDSPMPENGTMDSTQPRPDQPQRRTIAPAQKLAYLHGGEQAIQTVGQGMDFRAQPVRSLQGAGCLSRNRSPTRLRLARDESGNPIVVYARCWCIRPARR